MQINGLVGVANSEGEILALIEREVGCKPEDISRSPCYDGFIMSSCDYEKILRKFGLENGERFKQHRELD